MRVVDPMSTSQLEIREHRFMRIFNLAIASCFLFFAVVFAFLALATGVGAAFVLAGFGAVCSALFVLQFLSSRKQRWRLTADGIEIVGLFRQQFIPPEKMADLLIESFGNWPVYHSSLSLTDGKRRAVYIAELLISGEHCAMPSLEEFPVSLRNKTRIVANSGLKHRVLLGVVVLLLAILFAAYLRAML